jgi:molybdopterin synthase catalytic subunit
LAQSNNNQIAVTVLFFGAARDAVGQAEVDFILQGTPTATSAFAEILERFPDLRRFGRSLLFAVNQEYAPADREVHEGDELAVFPPVSGGAGKDVGSGGTGNAETASAGMLPADGVTTDVNANKMSALPANDFFELTTDPIDVGAVARRVVLPECGATVTLDGYAREWTRGRQTLHLVYEAYAPMALSELRRLGREAHERFEIAHLGIVHRTGRTEIGETSVLIAVSAPHRRAAFEACEWAIRELKRTVPIWKKEVFADGEVWVEGEARDLA